jgi:uncharacterized phage protein (TIGR01671 family)
MNRFKCPACGRNQYTSADTAQGCIYCGNKELKKMEILEPKEGEGMREIKFRGKRLDNGEWVYGYYYTQIITHAGNRKSRDHFMRTEQNIRYEVDPSTVGQFTGLKDKNGKEIYEGDVVRIDDLGIGIVDYEEGRFAMRRREERFCWPVYCRIDHSPFVPEVIGNIYENPELLKED